MQKTHPQQHNPPFESIFTSQNLPFFTLLSSSSMPIIPQNPKVVILKKHSTLLLNQQIPLKNLESQKTNSQCHEKAQSFTTLSSLLYNNPLLHNPNLHKFKNKQNPNPKIPKISKTKTI
jgi:hypothetical protein